MSVGAAVLIAAVGAIFRYAVADSVDGVDLATIGLILMIAGAVGFLLALLLEGTRRTDHVVERSGEPVRRAEIRERY
jgi:hypothetical protein